MAPDHLEVGQHYTGTHNFYPGWSSDERDHYFYLRIGDTPGCFFHLRNVRGAHLRELGVSVRQMAMQIIGLLDPRDTGP